MNLVKNIAKDLVAMFGGLFYGFFITSFFIILIGLILYGVLYIF